VENTLVLDNLDVVKVAGVATAYVFQLDTVVLDGFLTIELVGVVENPMISAIEVIRLPGAIAPVKPPTRAPTLAPSAADLTVARINVGGDALVDSKGKAWSADSFFADNGAGYWSCPKSINNTVDDDLYCTFRWYAPWHKSPYIYDIPVPSQSNYLVRLHFAEIVSARFIDWGVPSSFPCNHLGS
jgi:Malectin domain